MQKKKDAGPDCDHPLCGGSQLQISNDSQRENVSKKRIQRMKDDVREMKAERPRAPDSGIDQIAQNEEGPKKTTVLLTPNHGEVSTQDFSNLSKVVRKEPGVNDV